MISSIENYLDPSRYGAKAASLSFLHRNGFRVPAAIVIPGEIFHQHAIDTKEQLSNAVSDFLVQHPSPEGYMVRSSALGEDGTGNSFAGQLQSFICSNDPDQILFHITKCFDSRHDGNVKSYEQQSGRQLSGMAVIVQKLVQPDFAGVTFTRSPDRFDCMLTEYVKGHGEKLVSGKVNPERVYFSLPDGKQSGQSMQHFRLLFEQCSRIEKLSGRAMDVEWAMRDGHLHFVQARPVTTPLPRRTINWSNTNINENYPSPVSPLLYSVARDAYYNYFRNLASTFALTENEVFALEPEFCNVVGVFGGRLYYNMSSIHGIISAAPFSDLLSGAFNNFVGYAAPTRNSGNSDPGRKVRFVFNVLRSGRRLEKEVRAFEALADSYRNQVQDIITFTELKTSFHQFIAIRMNRWYKASLADFFAMLYHGLLGKFCRIYYGTSSSGIHNQLIQAIPGIISADPLVAMHALGMKISAHPEILQLLIKGDAGQFLRQVHSRLEYREISKAFHDYISNWGFRCSGELMLTETTYMDDPSLFVGLLNKYCSMPQPNPSEIISRKQEEARQVKKRFIRKIYSQNGINVLRSIVHHYILCLLIRKASSGIAARERVRLKQAQLYYYFKKVLGLAGKEFEKQGLISHSEDILYFTYKEIAEQLSASAIYAATGKDEINERKIRHARLTSEQFPDDFQTAEGIYVQRSAVRDKKQTIHGNLLQGLSACGGKISGTARVLNSIHEADKLMKGDILITRQTDPGWVVVFPLISGLVIERGGMLSHGAIVSREFGIPAVVGVNGATELIRDGAAISLDADNGQIVIHD